MYIEEKYIKAAAKQRLSFQTQLQQTVLRHFPFFLKRSPSMFSLGFFCLFLVSSIVYTYLPSTYSYLGMYVLTTKKWFLLLASYNYWLLLSTFSSWFRHFFSVFHPQKLSPALSVTRVGTTFIKYQALPISENMEAKINLGYFHI